MAVNATDAKEKQRGRKEERRSGQLVDDPLRDLSNCFPLRLFALFFASFALKALALVLDPSARRASRPRIRPRPAVPTRSGDRFALAAPQQVSRGPIR
jgi:hypothetical protein